VIETYAKQLEDIGADMKSVSSRDLQQNVPRHPLTILKPLHQVESTELSANIPLSPVDNIATAHPLSQSLTINSKKRPIFSTAENETRRKVRTISTSVVQEPPQTPKQLTQPQNSDFTGDSIDATVEDDSKDMTKQFIRTTLSILESEGITKVEWPTVTAKDCQLELIGNYRHLSLF